jgi:copper chaperone
MTEATYTVTGMTCEHCATSVREEVGAIGGVHDVAVDVPTGTVVVTSETAIGREDVRAAVEEAGYELTRI